MKKNKKNKMIFKLKNNMLIIEISYFKIMMMLRINKIIKSINLKLKIYKKLSIYIIELIK